MTTKILRKLFVNLLIALLIAGLANFDDGPSRHLIPGISCSCMSNNAQILAHSHGYHRKPRHLSQSNPKYHFLLLILLANDVQTNPGPVTRYNVYNVTDTKIILSKRRNVNAIEKDQKRQLFSELTEIEPIDYAGIDYCKGCWTPVMEDQEAVSCDKCPYWTHLPCSDLTQDFYNANKKHKL